MIRFDLGDEWVCWSFVERYWQGKTWIIWNGPAQVLVCRSEILHRLA